MLAKIYKNISILFLLVKFSSKNSTTICTISSPFCYKCKISINKRYENLVNWGTSVLSKIFIISTQASLSEYDPLSKQVLRSYFAPRISYCITNCALSGGILELAAMRSKLIAPFGFLKVSFLMSSL